MQNKRVSRAPPAWCELAVAAECTAVNSHSVWGVAVDIRSGRADWELCASQQHWGRRVPPGAPLLCCRAVRMGNAVGGIPCSRGVLGVHPGIVFCGGRTQGCGKHLNARGAILLWVTPCLPALLCSALLVSRAARGSTGSARAVLQEESRSRACPVSSTGILLEGF